MKESFCVIEEQAEKGRFVVETLEEGAFFEGHFPGRPILPAVAQLVLIDLLQSRLPGVTGNAGIVEVETLRCQGTVSPGERLDVRLDRDAGSSRLGFVIEGPSGPVSRGRLVLGEKDPT